MVESKKIDITCGTGEAPTVLSAFDKALFTAGIGNYNLIHLSSVIPTNHEPRVQQVNFNEVLEEYGKRLYVVYASCTEIIPGKTAWAGLGWVMAAEEPKRGLFVEHVGETEQEVVDLIESSLNSMVSYRSEKYLPVAHKVIGVKCVDKPVCALVAAIYQSAEW